MHIHVPAHALLYMSVISYTWVWLLVKILYFDSRTLVPKVDVDWENMTLVQKGRGWAVQSGRGWRGCRGRWPGLLKGHSISTLCRYMTFERCIGLKRRTRRPKYIPIPNEAAAAHEACGKNTIYIIHLSKGQTVGYKGQRTNIFISIYLCTHTIYGRRHADETTDVPFYYTVAMTYDILFIVLTP